MNRFADVCFIVTCKGRLQTLKASLPRMVCQPHSHVVVVDYDCPERSGDWAESLGCDVVRATEEPVFQVNRARQLGATRAYERGHALLCFVDADTLMVNSFSHIVLSMATPHRFLCFRRSRHNSGLGGVLAVATEAYWASGGHDVSYQNYGRNAADMRLTLFYHGLEYRFLPDNAADHHPHGERTRFYLVQDPMQSKRDNEGYLLTKIAHWRKQTGLEPPGDLWKRVTKTPLDDHAG